MFQSINPATGAPGERHAELTGDAVDARLDRAASAYAAWRTSEPAERAALLAAIADAFEAEKRALAEIATAEMGKTLASAIAEVEKCAAAFRFYAQEGPAMLAEPAVPGGGARARWLPIGPVLAVMPWNFPYWQAVRFLAPAILAGNAALLKHASNVQGVAAAMERTLIAAGAPAGLFQNLAVRSNRVGALIADARVAGVTLTGSEGAGRKVGEAAGAALKPVVLELGGSDPFIVLPSADIARAAKVAAKARVQNAGQSCICAKRMIVHADVYDAFLDGFVAAMAEVRVGDPMDGASDIGPLSSEAQRDAVLDQIAAMEAAGGRLIAGGVAPPGRGAFLTPGVVVDLPPDAPVAREEVFGPIATVFRAADLDAAIALANDTPFGLGASAWTQDPGERARLERDVDVGMIAFNAMLASTPEAPFGGIKASGHGRELGPWGMHAFMNLKAVFG
jgi:succinate-semialdehyde dehydrogenase/glutarate-semialdehyde dehydrogenase